MERFDLIVIGSGPAGEKGAAAAAFHKKRVALIEKENHLGGAAANTGTLPSKTLRETALVLSGIRQRNLFGLKIGFKEHVNIQTFLSHERRVKDIERVRIQDNLKRHGIQLFRGQASFIDAHTIAVTPERCDPVLLGADKILLATGSHPHRPKALFPFTNPRIFDSDTILTLYQVPDSLLVVGGGVIGCEYACMFNALGVRVALVEKRGGLLGGIDREVADALLAQMRDTGITVYFNDEVTQVGMPDLDTVEVKLKSGIKERVSAVLVSSGRSGNTEGLALDKVGIQVNERGQVLVNERYETNLSHVYAAGDVIGNPALASTAMAQARMAVAHAFNLTFDRGLTEVLPAGIYTIPECSSAGANEEELKKQGIPFVIGRAGYDKNARGQIIGDSKGFLKLLVHAETRKVLGVHLIGEQATELVHIGLTALMIEADVNLFIRTCYNYPTLSEVYKYAAYDALGQLAQRAETAAQEPAAEAPAETTSEREVKPTRGRRKGG